jgi:F-type H+-transporting ATPase subunit gamma
VDAVYIVYSRFRSALSQVPTLEKLLPVTLAETDELQAQQQTEYLYEPGVEQILASLLPRITGVAVQRALLEATASEHGARMTAMESASGNAAKMIGSLTLQMNRARQASITRELLEIVARRKPCVTMIVARDRSGIHGTWIDEPGARTRISEGLIK